MAGSNTGSGDAAIDAAAAAFADSLNPEGEEQEETEGEDESEAGLEAGAEEESGETEDEESAGESEESEGEEAEEDEQPAGRTFTVRGADGKEERVSESELIAGYQRQADYTRKTQALAAQRREQEQEASQARQERSEYAQLLPKLRSALQHSMGKEPNWEELRQKDPAQAAVAKQRWDEQQQRLQAIQAEEERVAQQNREEHEKLKKKILDEQAAKTLELLPQWAKPEVRKKDEAAIEALLRGLGFGDDELVIYDARAKAIALKAAKYDQVMAQKQKLQKQVKAAPAVKPGGNIARKATTEQQRASKRLAQTGSIRDAARVFEQFV
jgi:hypothetical protein